MPIRYRKCGFWLESVFKPKDELPTRPLLRCWWDWMRLITSEITLISWPVFPFPLFLSICAWCPQYLFAVRVKFGLYKREREGAGGSGREREGAGGSGRERKGAGWREGSGRWESESEIGKGGEWEKYRKREACKFMENDSS